MAYSTQQQVQVAVGGSAALRELSDQEDTGAIDVGIVATAIAEADALIDSYINQRYDVPLNPVPPPIANLSARHAARVLRRNRFKGQPIAEDLDAEAIDREWLDKIANGRVSLGINPTPTKATSVIDKGSVPRDPTFAISMDRLKGFI